MWLTKSNRPYHLKIGFWSAFFGTIIGSIEVGIALEGKDCQHDPDNAGKPIREWTWKSWDWKDFWATMLGGVMGQTVQIGVILLILWLI